MVSKIRIKIFIKRLLVVGGAYGAYRRVRNLAVKLLRVIRTPKLLATYVKKRQHVRQYKTAKMQFYKYGRITKPLKVLESIGGKDRANKELLATLRGLGRLQDGSSPCLNIPPRQPNPGVNAQSGHLLYCLHQSVPHSTNGYSTRSHGIATGLQQVGWNVSASTRTGYPWDSGIRVTGLGVHQEAVDGVIYTACSGWNLNKTPLDHYISEAADHFFREAQLHGAEVVVSASNHITALPALIAARRLGLPFVYEVRGLWEVTQASTQPKWAKSERFQLMKRLEALVACEADLVMTLTDELAGELVARGVAQANIHLAPNAVDTERFSPRTADAKILQELQIPEGIPVIGYAGSAVAYEGLDLLLEALADLKKKQVDYIFLLVGDGKVLEVVKSRAAELDIMSHCRFPGRVPFDVVPDYISCMDIMPIPRLSSAVTELVSPLKPLEAMAMAKAVVLSDVAPHKVFAGNGDRAVLFEKGSRASLLAVLEQLIQQPDVRRDLGRAARDWVVNERRWQQIASEYSRLLNEMLQQQNCREEEPQARGLNEITLGLVADLFTTTTLSSAVKIVPLSPENWQKEIEIEKLDAVLIESAWKGSKGSWYRKVGYYSDEEFAPLQELLGYCREKAIPSLFWNKEDPVHFERFKEAAALCDHVFTTDSRRIIPYLLLKNSCIKTASSCPFFASPAIHNLLPSTSKWSDTALYGGTYYGDRYPERSLYMDMIMSAAAPLGLTIYDRQHKDPQSPYKFPDGLDAYVAGDLTYDEMIQAYKSHPVQINVNSVLDSPTMFSRRVLEAAACGAAIISGPALGMNRYLAGAAQIIKSESEAAKALEGMLHHPANRKRVALKGARAVMRAHTTEHRVIQMLRTAGLQLAMPRVAKFDLYTKKVSKTAAQRLMKQTIRPRRVFSEQWGEGTMATLLDVGIRCLSPDSELAQSGDYCFIAEPEALEDVEQEDFEDLINITRYSSSPRIGFNRAIETSSSCDEALIQLDADINLGLQLLKIPGGQSMKDLAVWSTTQEAVGLHKPPVGYARLPVIMSEKTLVIAGHDLKFIKPFYPYFTKAGIRILLDFWQGHSHHNKVVSKRLLAQADTVFCEWMLGNAIWYGKNKREGQKLVGRLHAQELRSPLLKKLPFEQFEKVVFVGPHMLRNAQKSHPELKENGLVVYNGVDVDGLQLVSREKSKYKVLGLVGMVPQSKRLDRALDILKELRKEDDSYILRVKGKQPKDYPWMAGRTDEMAWYESVYRRLKEDPGLKGSVFFDEQGDDMPQWYAGIDYVLSVSDHESFHLAVAEGAVAGCIPIVSPWEGAEEIYPKEWVFSEVEDAVNAIRSGLGDKIQIAAFSKSQFDRRDVAKKLVGLV
jgi:glycosyltransferase involved in cell wall biosynthesis